MKKKLVAILFTVMTVCVSAVCFAACGEPPHTHLFDQTVATEEYIFHMATCDEKATYFYSCACGTKGTEVFEYGEPLGHDISATPHNNGTHTIICSRDSSHSATLNCSGGTATCKEKAKCEVCNASYGDYGGHVVSGWEKEGDEHWQVCTVEGCGEILNKEKHSFSDYVYNNDGSCKADGTETATCSCGATDTRTKAGTKRAHDVDVKVLDYSTPGNYGGYFAMKVFCKTCNTQLHHVEEYTDPLMSGGVNVITKFRWNQNPLLANVPYPTEGQSTTLYLTTANESYQGYNGYAGGMFKGVSESYFRTYKSLLKSTFSDVKIDYTTAFQAYDEDRTMLLTVGYGDGTLTILVYKLTSEYLQDVKVEGDYNLFPHTCENKTLGENTTCTKGGYVVKYCALCGWAEITSKTEPTGHSEINLNGYEATCTESGLTDGKRCTVCGVVTEEQRTIQPLGHIDIDGECDRCHEYIEYTATFKAEGNTIETIKFTKNTKSLVEPAVPEKIGYTGAWSEYALGLQDIVINAVYTKITYTITYEVGAGRNNPLNPTSYSYGDNIELHEPTAPSGKTFGGWFTDSKYLASSAINAITGEMYGPITLYAQWLSYRIEKATGFEINYGGIMPTIRTEVPSTTASFDFKDKITVSRGCTWKLYGDEYGSIMYDRKMVPLNNSGENLFYISVVYPDGETDVQYLVIVYRLHVYKYEYESLGKQISAGEIEEKSYIPTMENPSEDGYIFSHWAVEDKVITLPYIARKDVKITAVYTPIDYNITYVLNNGGNNENNVATYNIETETFTLLEPEREHYTFSGWFTTQTFEEGSEISQIEQGSFGEKTLYAKWTPVEYNITYILNGGVTADNSPATYNIENVTTLVSAKRACYIFEGWFTTQTLEEGSEIFQIEQGNFGEKTLYAKWKLDPVMEKFNYTATATTCKITSLKDETLSEVIIPDYVTSIGADAFSGCTSLTKVNYTGTIDSWAEISFSSATSNPLYYAKNLYIDNKLVSEANITSAFKISAYAFYGCASLTSVTIGDSVTSIGSNAFYECYKLIEVINKSSHITVTKGSSDNGYVGYYALYVSNRDDSYVSRVSTDSNGYVTYVDGADKMLVNYVGNETELTLPSDITKIRQYAFYNNDKITSVTIGDSVTSIGYSAFSGCYNLVEVINKSSHITIEKGSADNGYVGYYAFSVFNSGDTYVNKFLTDSNGYVTYVDGAEKILVNYVGTATELILPSDITKIHQYAFYDNDKITSVTIGYSVKSIGDEAFYSCSSLTSVTIGEGVTSIGKYTFRYCGSLTSVTIGDSVKSIGSSAFSGCSKLEEITIPFVGAKAGVTSSSTYQYPFGYIFGTSNYTGGVATTQYYYGSSKSETTYSTYYIPATLTKVTVTGGYIPYAAFRNCSKLTSVTIGDSVTSIGEWAFEYCTSLTSVTIGDSVTSIGDYTFRNCISLTSVTIGNNVTSIGSYAFRNCSSLRSVTIPNSVTSIGGGAFEVCSKLEEITIPFVGAKAGVTSSSTYQYPFGYIFGSLNYTGGVGATEQYYYGSSTSSTTSTTFYLPATLKKVTVTGGYIPYGAFYNCSSLTSVTIGGSVTSIGDRAFYNCDSLTSVTIGGSVTSIGDRAFYYCSSLKSIKYRGTSSQWSAISKGYYWNKQTGSYTITYNYTGE